MTTEAQGVLVPDLSILSVTLLGEGGGIPQSLRLRMLSVLRTPSDLAALRSNHNNQLRANLTEIYHDRIPAPWRAATERPARWSRSRNTLESAGLIKRIRHGRTTIIHHTTRDTALLDVFS